MRSKTPQPTSPKSRPVAAGRRTRLFALLAALVVALTAYIATDGWRRRLRQESARSRQVIAAVEEARTAQAAREARRRELQARLLSTPGDADARLALAELQWATAGPAAAAALLEETPAHALTGRTLLALAGAQRAMGREDLALETLDRGVKLFPREGDLWMERAAVYSWMGWFRHSDEALREAEARSADPSRIVLVRVLAARQQRELRVARRLLEAALRAYPDDPELLKQMAAVAEAEGRIDEAGRLLERLAAADPDPELLVGVARLRLRRPDARMRAQARGELERALALRPGMGSARFLLGRCLRLSGELTEARSLLEQLYREQPRRPGVAFELAQLYRALGLKKQAAPLMAAHQQAMRAREEMRRAALAVMSHPDSALAHRNIGRLCAERRLIGRAILSFERSLDLNPRQPDVRAELARLRGQFGRRAGEMGEASDPDEQ